jgi:hypothetical protein
MTLVLTSKVYAQGGLVGYWKFDEGSGNIAADSSGNGNNGTLENAPGWVNGENGSGLSFDGVDDFVLVPDSSSLHISGAVTVMAWVYLPSGSDCSGHPKILSKNGPSNVLDLELSIQDNAGHVGFGVGGVYPDNYLVSTGSVPRNLWTHIAATYDGSLLKIYLNGVFDSSLAFTGGINTDNDRPLTIGKNNFYPWSYEYWLNATIDEVRVYNRALSQQEIQLVVPEFPSFLVVPLFMMATLLAVVVYRRKVRS